MATYALLGSTGQVGGSILEILLQDPGRKIHACARSRQKLLKLHPELESSPNVTIFEGSLDDIDMLAKCIAGTHAVFLAAAASDNIPNCNVARVQAKCIVAALEQLRNQDPQARLPKMIVLSSASLEPHLVTEIPAIGNFIIKRAASNVYADLRLAETFLRTHDWIQQVYIKPGGLSHDKQIGHSLSTERGSGSFLSFLDLAAGMVEVAEADGDRWDGRNVSVLPADPGARFERYVPWFVAKGMTWHYFPWLYPYLAAWLP